MKIEEIDGEIEAVILELQGIEAQFTASKQRISEMALRPGYKKSAAYLSECDWRRRAMYAKQKILDELRDLKGRRKEMAILEDSAVNHFTCRLRVASKCILMAYDSGTDADLKDAIGVLRDALGQGAA